MSAPFYTTGFGRKFFESDVPRLLTALERIAAALEAIAARPDPKPESTPPQTPEEPK